MRNTEDFIAMGYNIDQAELQRQEEALQAAGKLPTKQEGKENGSKAVKQSKEEQE